MPNRQIINGEPYRYAYQGQEKDPETGKEAFQLRLWDGRIGRWLTVDPYGEFNSPYLGMGNQPVNTTDPDGGRTCRDSSGNVVDCTDYGLSPIYNLDIELPDGSRPFDMNILDEVSVISRRPGSWGSDAFALHKINKLEELKQARAETSKAFF